MKSVKSINPFKSVIQTIYNIVKAHGDELKVETKKDEGLPNSNRSERAGSTFIIQIPTN